VSKRKIQTHPLDTLKSPKNPAIPNNIYDIVLILTFYKLRCRWIYQRKIPRAKLSICGFSYIGHVPPERRPQLTEILLMCFSRQIIFFAYSISMLLQYKYTHEELEKAGESKAKKYIN
jgi:hypothetical protein